MASTPGRSTPADLDRAHDAAAAVLDPELPMLTLADLGVLRSVTADGDRLVVTLTPTYTGCPALATMRADVRIALQAAGFADVDVRTALTPAWTTDWLTDHAREVLREHGIAPPGRHAAGPVELPLLAAAPTTRCPRCGSTSTRETSRFGPTPCTAQHVCASCAEPFERMKEL
jgi:ring-1,2-phenylacetyl-CoA epoxidase subunit PaaD